MAAERALETILLHWVKVLGEKERKRPKPFPDSLKISVDHFINTKPRGKINEKLEEKLKGFFRPSPVRYQ